MCDHDVDPFGDVTATDPGDVMRGAREVEGMVAFFSLLGSAINHGNSTTAFEALQRTGLELGRAWALVEGWAGTEGRELRTGWTAEVAAMAVVINDCSHWRTINWRELTKLFVG